MARRLKAAFSGGGALPPYIDNFFNAIGINILEAYGLTETSPEYPDGILIIMFYILLVLLLRKRK